MGSGEDITDAVGRVTLDGTVTVFPLYPCACFPIGITTGPDGNLWAAEELGAYNGESTGTIDRITPDGKTITRFPVPLVSGTESHLPAFVAPGPDGNVWFTEYNATFHRIGRAKPNGAIKEFTLPGDVTNSAGITTGPDGQIWVTQADANDIAVVKTSGAFVKGLPTHHEPVGITVGPDGNMWFALALDGEIGRVPTARAGYAYVLEIAPGFVPVQRTVALGTTVQWVLEAPGLHRVKDTTGLGLYDSGPKPPVSFQLYTFTAAGTYPYHDGPGNEGGAIAVRVDAPSSGPSGEAFDVTWASAAPPAGRVFDVQVKVPGGSWQAWQSGVTTLSASYIPCAAGAYRFRARMRQGGGSAGTLWSPSTKVKIV
jgi:plastocyanin